MHSKVEAVACRTLKINIVFIVSVLVNVTVRINDDLTTTRDR